MPEGPEVERTRKWLEKNLLDKTVRYVAHREKLRTPIPQKIKGLYRVIQVGRQGKLLLLALEPRNELKSRVWLGVHLGMSGHFKRLDQNQEIPKHAAFELTLNSSGSHITFVDPRRFGAVIQAKSRKSLSKKPYYPKGVDIFHGIKMTKISPSHVSDAAAVNALIDDAEGRKGDLKGLLMDQSWLAGLGNIYAAEACYVANISPFQAVSTLSRKQLKTVILAARIVTQRALENKGTTFKGANKFEVAGEYGGTSHLFVYGRDGEKCRGVAKPKCRGIIEKKEQAGRSTFYCPKCQGL